MPSSVTGTSLLRRVQARDEDAWRSLTELYGPLVFHWCRRMGLDSHQSADVFQEVFAAVARAMPTYEITTSKGSFRGWLWTITRNKVLDDHRRRSRQPNAEGGTEAMLRFSQQTDPFTEDSIDAQDLTETTSLVHRALAMIRAEFEPRTWEAFWRAAVQQHATVDIAKDLGLSAASVRQAKSRVLRRLRAVVEF